MRNLATSDAIHPRLRDMDAPATAQVAEVGCGLSFSGVVCSGLILLKFHRIY